MTSWLPLHEHEHADVHLGEETTVWPGLCRACLPEQGLALTFLGGRSVEEDRQERAGMHNTMIATASSYITALSSFVRLCSPLHHSFLPLTLVILQLHTAHYTLQRQTTCIHRQYQASIPCANNTSQSVCPGQPSHHGKPCKLTPRSFGDLEDKFVPESSYLQLSFDSGCLQPVLVVCHSYFLFLLFHLRKYPHPNRKATSSQQAHHERTRIRLEGRIILGLSAYCPLCPHCRCNYDPARSFACLQQL